LFGASWRCGKPSEEYTLFLPFFANLLEQAACLPATPKVISYSNFCLITFVGMQQRHTVPRDFFVPVVSGHNIKKKQTNINSRAIYFTDDYTKHICMHRQWHDEACPEHWLRSSAIMRPRSRAQCVKLQKVRKIIDSISPAHLQLLCCPDSEN
jgi:hypothetical protein